MSAQIRAPIVKTELYDTALHSQEGQIVATMF